MTGSGFIGQPSPEALSDKALTGSGYPEILVKVGRTRVRALTEVEVVAYWQWKAENGNKEAKALTIALAAEALRRRANDAFGVQESSAVIEKRTESLRLHLIETWVTQYELKQRQDFEQNASDLEKELVFAKVSVNRYQSFLDNWTGYKDTPEYTRALEGLQYNQGRVQQLTSEITGSPK